jgi:hypothetical protein
MTKVRHGVLLLIEISLSNSDDFGVLRPDDSSACRDCLARRLVENFKNILAPALMGQSVLVRHEISGENRTDLEMVQSVDVVGEIEIQHISVGDKCFWAGEKPGSYILHHNKEEEPSPGEGDDDE